MGGPRSSKVVAKRASRAPASDGLRSIASQQPQASEADNRAASPAPSAARRPRESKVGTAAATSPAPARGGPGDARCASQQQSKVAGEVASQAPDGLIGSSRASERPEAAEADDGTALPAPARGGSKDSRKVPRRSRTSDTDVGRASPAPACGGSRGEIRASQREAASEADDGTTSLGPDGDGSRGVRNVVRRRGAPEPHASPSSSHAGVAKPSGAKQRGAGKARLLLKRPTAVAKLASKSSGLAMPRDLGALTKELSVDNAVTDEKGNLLLNHYCRNFSAAFRTD